MFGQQSTFVSMVRCFALVILFQFSASLSGAQTPRPPAEKPSTDASPQEQQRTPDSPTPPVVAPPVNSEPDATKPKEPTISEAALMNVKVEETPKLAPEAAVPQAACKREISADVVALAQPFMLNRIGAAIPGGLVFVLRSDTVVEAGNRVRLKDGKRPRPIVLRANVGDCLTITFTNFIRKEDFANSAVTPPFNTSEVSLHVQGMEWVQGSQDDGSFVGKNDSSLASVLNPPITPASPQVQTYRLHARQEGTFLLYSMGDTSSTGDQIARGLFGALNVQPEGAEWYRSQVSADDLQRATYNASQVPAGSLNCPAATPTKCTFTVNGKTVNVIKAPGGFLQTTDNHPLINYNATRSDGSPILKMLDANKKIVYTDLTAMITGPNAGRFEGTTGANNPETPCNAENNPALNPPPGGKVDPLFCQNPAAPDRKQPYREITVIYHGALNPVATQAFPVLQTSDPMSPTTTAGQDAFGINYGTGGIGAEIYANRLGLGPMGACADCKFEEFFLSAWSVGDPAMLVDRPANSMLPAAGPPPPGSPAKPPVPPPPPLCTTAQLEGKSPTPPNPQCANSRQPNPFGEPYSLAPLAKATRAYYPDDPSNVFHSYINDHVKFRILHGGRDVTHVHHQHAHQWLQSPNSDQSSYLDSQMISPGASYTLEMVYNGSGNRNKVVGDSIFHCHFYPHFAAGMWAMWRTHDVFESGTFVYPQGTSISGKDVSGLVVPGSRALPDGEITTGTPMPAIVPLPTLPMAPLPAYAQIKNNVPVNGTPIPYGSQVVIGGTCEAGNKINGLDVIGGCTVGNEVHGTVISSQFNGTVMTGEFLPTPGNALTNPGFPYFIPGVAGARPPHPPLDFAPDGAGGFMDGGLPRHILTGGKIKNESHNKLDWSKDLLSAVATQLPEDGTLVEKAAIAFFGIRCHPTPLPDGTPGSCPSSASTPPQSTLNTPPTGFILNGLPNGPQPGAPFADPAIDDNGNPVGTKRTYKAAAIQLDVTFNKKGWHFPQQRILTLWKDVTPTFAYKPGGSTGRQPEPLFFRGNTGDIIEYWHTNLVPNYFEQDAFQVRTPTDILGQHIHLVKFDVTSSDGAGNGFNYEDGTFSPEEVQELIAALNNGAAGGSWTHCTGCSTNLRAAQPPPPDICSGIPLPAQCAHEWLGAQTTIQRWYLDPLVDDSGTDRTLRTVFTHDHFGPSTHQQAGLYAGLLLEPKGSTWTSNDGAVTFGSRSDGGPTSWQARIINGQDSYREFMLEFQDLQLAYYPKSIGGKAINAPSTPSLITTGISLLPAGTQSVNYTNEPIGFRIGEFKDPSYVYDNATAKQVDPVNNPDPMTPLLRAYQNDKVQIRTLVGAHVFSHQFNLAGPTWFSEPSWKNSGYRSTQAMGLSEHYEMLFNVPSSSAPNTARKCPDGKSQANCVDYFYSPSMDKSGLAHGLWGIFRSYDPTQKATGLEPLPNNPIGPTSPVAYKTCPDDAAQRVFNVTAITAGQAVGSSGIVFNTRGAKLLNPLGVLYVRSEDLTSGKLNAGVPVEPLILRANAGDCIEVNLTNGIASGAPVLNTSFLAQWTPPFNGTPFKPNSKMSSYVGLHPQLLSYDAATSIGMNIGWNSQGGKNQLTGIGGQVIKYQWYAGKIERNPDGTLKHTPVEFGAVGLFPSDPLFQHLNGLIGQMIIEPAGATWQCGDPGNLADCDPPVSPPTSGTSGTPPTPPTPPTTRASATITLANNAGKFREFNLLISDNIRIGEGTNFNVGYTAANYRSEPWKFRYTGNAIGDFSCMLSDQLISGNQDPQTPIFKADIGDAVRFRMTHPFGTGTSQVFSLHGHVWQRNPYTDESTKIGDNKLSQWIGSRDNHGATDHFDAVIDKAGGAFGQAGDYLYTVFQPLQASQGQWGIFRVGNASGTGTINGACKPVVKPGYKPPTPKTDLDRFVRP